MGSTMSKAQEAVLAEHFAQVVVMLDGDEAGRRATQEISDRLEYVVYYVKRIELPNGVQSDELSSEEINALLRCSE